MKLKDQVCSLELSKKLKELRVKQESLFYWRTYSTLGYEIIRRRNVVGDEFDSDIAAFTVAELGEMLPWGTNFEKYKSKGKERFCVIEVESIKNMAIHDDTEVDARAKMLIYLIENRLVKP